MPPSEAREEAGERAAEPEPPRRISLDFVLETESWQALAPFERLLSPLLAELARHHAVADYLPAEACVALVDDAAMRRLNSQFRSKDKPTNVLSFPSGIGIDAGADGPRQLGDIALGFETVMQEAAEQDVTPADHVRHLVLHGLLHLVGFDHETDGDAEAMEALEIEILAGIGIANPYEEAAGTPQPQ